MIFMTSHAGADGCRPKIVGLVTGGAGIVSVDESRRRWNGRRFDLGLDQRRRGASLVALGTGIGRPFRCAVRLMAVDTRRRLATLRRRLPAVVQSDLLVALGAVDGPERELLMGVMAFEAILLRVDYDGRVRALLFLVATLAVLHIEEEVRRCAAGTKLWAL